MLSLSMDSQYEKTRTFYLRLIYVFLLITEFPFVGANYSVRRKFTRRRVR